MKNNLQPHEMAGVTIAGISTLALLVTAPIFGLVLGVGLFFYPQIKDFLTKK